MRSLSNRNNYHHQFIEEIRRYLAESGEYSISLFNKGRIALYALLKSAEVSHECEVIVPGFTCVVVPNAVLYTGAKPVYVDIHPETLLPNPDLVSQKLSSKTRVIISQNTFGIPQDAQSLLELTKGTDIKVIEDAAHGFGGSTQGVLNGTMADAAFFSLQWNKMFTAGIGGIAVSRSESMSRKLLELSANLPMPSFTQELSIAIQLVGRSLFLSPSNYNRIIKFYRYLTLNGFLTGSNDGIEVTGTHVPENYLLSMGKIQAREGLRGLRSVAQNRNHRKRIAAIYNNELTSLGFHLPYDPPGADITFIKYPVFVKDRSIIFSLALKHGIEISDWFATPLYPVEGNLDPWGFNPSECPVSVALSSHIINFPTHQKIDDFQVEKTIEFVKKYREQFYSSPLECR